MNEYTYLTISEIVAGIRSKKFSAEDICRASLYHINRYDDSLGCFLTVTDAEAVGQAQGIDRRIAQGEEVGELAGVPIAIKDNILIRGVRCTGGSRILDTYTAAYDATVIQRLHDASAVFVGKTNLDEFAMGASTENSAFHPTKNPWEPARVPGGSSGGSAAAVGAGMTPVALGSDTGGSVRQPAALCGVVGMKPSYGRVSRSGLIALSSSLDQIGPLASTVEDAARVFLTIAGKDAKDATTVDKPIFALPDIKQDIKGLRIGIPSEFFVEGMDPAVRTHIEAALEVLKKQGAKLVEIQLPNAMHSLAVYYVTLTSEVSTNLARLDGVRYGPGLPEGDTLADAYSALRGKRFGAEAKRRIMLGTFALSKGYYKKYYHQAQKVRAVVRSEFADVFKKVDCIASATSPTVAFKLGERYDDPLTMYLSDILTVPANIAGIPAISVPCGFSEGLPVGLQIMGKLWDEKTVFMAAHAYEQATDWHTRRPVLST